MSYYFLSKLLSLRKNKREERFFIVHEKHSLLLDISSAKPTTICLVLSYVV